MNPLPTLDIMTISIDSSLRSAVETITKNSQGICFIVEKVKFKGIITDGDLRRALLAGADMHSPVKNYMKINAVTLPVTANPVEIQQTFSNNIHHIPLLDEEGNLIDYVSKNHFNRIPLAEPLLSGNELLYVTECIQSNWISSRGRFVSEFENMFKELHQMSEAIAVSNGTVALSLALESLGIGVGDEVIVPNLTFAASINAIIHVGATPVIVDVESVTWTLDVLLFEQAITPLTKAVMPVHLYGHPSDMIRIVEIAKKNNLLVIEDCAEALGSKVDGRLVGTFGDAACFSFFGNKTITTGEGGMILFKDIIIAQKAKILRDHGMSPKKKYWHEVVGYNYRLTNLQAAIGVAQMEKIDFLLNNKRELAIQYSKELLGIPNIILPSETSWAYNTYWLYTVLVLPDSGINRDDLISAMALNGIETRAVFQPLNTMPIYEKYTMGKDFPKSEYISRYGICLPSASATQSKEVIQVAEVFKTILKSVFLQTKVSASI